MQLKLVALALLTFACSAATPPSAIEVLESTTAEPATTLPVASNAPEEERFPGGRRLWRVDAATLNPIPGTAIGPVGKSVEEVAATEDEVAFVGNNYPAWVLWLLNRQTGKLTNLFDGSPRHSSPRAIWIGEDGVDWLTDLKRPRGNPEIPDGFVVYRWNRISNRIARVELDAHGFYADPLFVSRDRVTLFGRNRALDTPRVMVFDLNDGQAVLDLSLEVAPPVIDVNDAVEDASVHPGWASSRDLLYVPHLYSDRVTTVDLDNGSIVTQAIVPKASFLDRLIPAWQPTAQAKSGASSSMTAKVSTDGTVLYITGNELDWPEALSGSYQDVPLGIDAVDIATMTEVALSDLPIDRIAISPTGETLLAIGSWDDPIAGTFGNSSGLHLLDAKTLEPLLWVEPTDPPESYELSYSADGRYAYANGVYGPSTIIIDTTNLEASQVPTLERFNAELLQLGYIVDF